MFIRLIMIIYRIGYFICFLYCINLGIIILGAKTMHNRDVLVDFRDMGYFYVIPGVVVIGFGFALLYLTLRKTPKYYRPENLILKCKECRRSFNYEDTDNEKCPKCNGELVEIETYYANRQLYKRTKVPKNKKHKKDKIQTDKTNQNKKIDINSVKLSK